MHASENYPDMQQPSSHKHPSSYDRMHEHLDELTAQLGRLEDRLTPLLPNGYRETTVMKLPEEAASTQLEDFANRLGRQVNRTRVLADSLDL